MSPKLVIVLGTRAQVVKMAPVLLALERRRVPFRLLLTGQHMATVEDMLRDFGVDTQAEWLCPPQEVLTVARFPFWLRSALARCVAVVREPQCAAVVTHGDTVSTLVAAVAGYLAQRPVAHVECGLRSPYLLNPFPEEIIRRLCARLAAVAFAPGPWAARNLTRPRTRVVDTAHNTIIDALRIALKQQGRRVPAGSNHVVVSIHRFENLRRSRLRKIVGLLTALSEDYTIDFVLHPVTRRRLDATGLLSVLTRTSGIVLHNRMPYFSFISLLARACGVITDGGSNQEELYYLGKPTVVLRKATERIEGLGSSAVVLDPERATPETVREALRREAKPRIQDVSVEPSETIAATLEELLRVEAAARRS